MAADGHASLAAYRRATELVPDEPWTESRARVLSGLSQSLMLAGRARESRELAELAIDIARHVGARAIEGLRATTWASTCVSWATSSMTSVAAASVPRVERGVALLREARQIAEDVADDVDDIARAIVNLSSVLCDAGRLEEAAQVALEGLVVVERLGLARRKGVWCRCDAADALLRLGRRDEAEQLVTEALQLDPTGIDLARATWLRGVLRLRTGDLEVATRALEEAGDLLAHGIDDQFVGPFTADARSSRCSRRVAPTARSPRNCS